MRIRTSAPKCRGAEVHREIAVEETLARVTPYLHDVGITRVADITGLDRIGIPVYNAIVPRSRDFISVYNGKGVRPVDAKASAIMEAIERFSAWLPRAPAAVAAYNDLVKRGRTVMDPSSFNVQLSKFYRDDRPISWTEGWDLIAEEPVLVPMHCAVYLDRFHEKRVYEIVSTNGLASGNTLEEATLHALCELIERDSLTLAEMVTNHLSGVLGGDLVSVKQPTSVTEMLRARHPHFDMTSLPPRVNALIEKFHAAGVEVRMADVTSDIGVPSVWCVAVDSLGVAQEETGHSGLGTHLDLEVAMLRAITECAQSRAVDIQAMREDISMPDEDVPSFFKHVQRPKKLDKTGWWWRPSGQLRQASEFVSQSSDDVAEDLRTVLDRLRGAGIERAIVINLSPPGIPANVVRVLVPDLESWTIDQSKLGSRATAVWTAAVRELGEKQKVGNR
jgi:ribosomal protein S12 methylthiotransferase accessory factor